MGVQYYLGLAFFVFGTLIVLAIRRRVLHAPKPQEAGCGRCGYLVIGLPTNICPECGSDLNIVGLRRPSRWMRLHASTRRDILLALWTLWCVAAAILLWRPFTSYLVPCTIMESDSVLLAPVRKRDNLSIEYTIAWRQRFGICEQGRVLDGTSQFCRWDDPITGWCLKVSTRPGTTVTGPSQVLDLAGGSIGRVDEKRFSVDLDQRAYAFDDPQGLGRIRRTGAWEKDFVAWMAQVAQRMNFPELVSEMPLGRCWDCCGDMPYRGGELPDEHCGFFGTAKASQLIRRVGQESTKVWEADWRYSSGGLVLGVFVWLLGIVRIVRR